MLCSSCGSENRESAKFCARCGNGLSLACPSCGSAYQSGDLFCVECGTALTASTAAVPLPPPQAPPAAERRLVSRALRRPRRFHGSLGSPRSGGDARTSLQVLRHLPAPDRALRRHGREVHRRRRHGRLGGADCNRGRRRARGSRGARSGGGRPRRSETKWARRSCEPGQVSLTGEAAVTLGAEGQGMVAGDLVNTASRDPVDRGARHAWSPARRPGGRPTRQSSTRTPASTSSRERPNSSNSGRRCASSPALGERSSPQGSKRPSSAGTASYVESRISFTRAPTRASRS